MYIQFQLLVTCFACRQIRPTLIKKTVLILEKTRSFSGISISFKASISLLCRQVDPNFSYAYTLLGHEYVMIEELEKALACYRNAVRIDPRHYNAWYGIGLTYYKQERFSLADG